MNYKYQNNKHYYWRINLIYNNILKVWQSDIELIYNSPEFSYVYFQVRKEREYYCWLIRQLIKNEY